jgi:putative ABC transport system permease protein
MMSAFDRSAYSSLTVQLVSPKDFQRFKDALTSDPRMAVEVKRSRDYVADQTKQLTSVLNFIAYFVGTIMAVGAIFGAVNTMYSVVDGRAREIATLRAIGFGGLPVVISVMTETLMLAIPGALLGVAIAWLLFNGHAARISSLSIPIAVTPGLTLLAVIWAIVIGFLGGLAPSIRAARLPVATALRAT